MVGNGAKDIELMVVHCLLFSVCYNLNSMGL